jgi:hypothetical protein
MSCPFKTSSVTNGSAEYIAWEWATKSIVTYQMSHGLHDRRTWRSRISSYGDTWKNACTGFARTECRRLSVLFLGRNFDHKWALFGRFNDSFLIRLSRVANEDHLWDIICRKLKLSNKFLLFYIIEVHLISYVSRYVKYCLSKIMSRLCVILYFVFFMCVFNEYTVVSKGPVGTHWPQAAHPRQQECNTFLPHMFMCLV